MSKLRHSRHLAFSFSTSLPHPSPSDQTQRTPCPKRHYNSFSQTSLHSTIPDPLLQIASQQLQIKHKIRSFRKQITPGISRTRRVESVWSKKKKDSGIAMRGEFRDGDFWFRVWEELRLALGWGSAETASGVIRPHGWFWDLNVGRWVGSI
jgi:hypothetical protein